MRYRDAWQGLMVREDDMPPGLVAPYEIQRHDDPPDCFTWAPTDDDRIIRRKGGVQGGVQGSAQASSAAGSVAAGVAAADESVPLPKVPKTAEVLPTVPTID